MFELTEEQKEIIAYDGTCFVLALAGGSKTFTVSEKIKHIKRNKPESRILYITFTRKAKEHAENILKGLPLVNVTNYHQLGYRIMMLHKKELQVSDIDIVGETYCCTIISNLFQVGNKEARDIFSRILKLKSDEVLLKDMSSEEKHLYTNFHSALRRSRKYIYADLVQETNRLFEERKIKYRASALFRYDYIFIDEMQDNYIGEYKMVDNLLSLNPACILNAVFDINQSIFSFSNANPAMCIEFMIKHGDKRFTLSNNFRSQSKIIKLGNVFLDNISEFSDFRPELKGTKEEGENIERWTFGDPYVQYQAVCNEILRLVSSGYCKFSDIYILYRTNLSGTFFERVSLKNRVPFKVARGSLLDSKTTQCLINLIRFSCRFTEGTFSREELFDLVTVLATEMAPDVAGETIKAVNEVESAWSLIQKIQNINELNVSGIGPSRKKSLIAFHKKLLKICEVYEGYKEDLNVTKLVQTLGSFILEFKFAKKATAIVFESITEDLSIMEDLLVNLEGSLLDRVSQIMIDYRESDSGKDDNKVLGLTVHKSKGLENRVVFIVDFHKFPAQFGEEAEEERVAYVAVTRPKDRLYITSAGPTMWDGLFEGLSYVNRKQFSYLPHY